MSVAEAAAAKGPLAAPLADGVNTLSQDQTVTFDHYTKRVIPIDGSVYWIKTVLIDPTRAGLTLTVQGSLHFATEQAQREDETFGVNHVVFTALRQVDEFNEIAPDAMWLGEDQGIRFSFAARGMFYRQADLHHYRGDAVYPAFASQLIDTANALLDLGEATVSNSLPIWLTLTQGGAYRLYPSFLVGENIEPPYIAVHVVPEATSVFAPAPVLDYNSGRSALATDRVRLTLYGLRHSQALDYLDYVLAFMRDGAALGLMNLPVIRDDKRIQNELTVLAQKKTIEFQVSYLQQTARTIARQLILSAICAVEIGD